MGFKPDTKVLNLYVKWIEKFDPRYARAWAHRYKSDPEAAMCEAMFWGMLEDCSVSVEPNEDLEEGKSAPDFACTKDGKKFYVEVTCIHTDRATELTGLPDALPDGAQNYGPLNSAIFEKVKQKTPQCGDLDAPAIVAVGTFHSQASCLCVAKGHIEDLLTGDQLISFLVDTQTGGAVGESFISTKLKSATFLRPSSEAGMEEARAPVSAVLVAGFGCKPPNVYGLMHPLPRRPFDRTLLDNIEFCRLLRNETEKTLSVEWF